MAFIWVGLYFSYSQSSMVALAASTVLVTTLAGGRRTRRLMAAAVAGVVILGAVAFVTLVRDHSVNRVVSGRWTLVQDTWVVFGNHPLEGVGVASQPAASRDETGGPLEAPHDLAHGAAHRRGRARDLRDLRSTSRSSRRAAQLFWSLRRYDEALGPRAARRAHRPRRPLALLRRLLRGSAALGGARRRRGGDARLRAGRAGSSA